MSKGSSGGSYVPSLSPEQNAMIRAQTGFFTNTVQPNYELATQGATNLYQGELPYVTNAAQNLAGVAGQAQNVLGTTGQNALASGVGALQNIASPAYQQAQLQAALAPAQAQYQQNIANQRAQFGAAGNLGSAREALAERQTAGNAMSGQQQATAAVLRDIAQQQMAAGTQLGQFGLAGLSGAQGAAQNQLTAAFTPQQLFNQYASALYGTPAASYSPNFSGTQGYNTTGQTTNIGASGVLGTIGGLSALFSDINLKEHIVYVGDHQGHRLYDFNYRGRPERYRGVMAQDVLGYRPDAVVVDSSGYLKVDYAMLGLEMIEIKQGQ